MTGKSGDNGRKPAAGVPIRSGEDIAAMERTGKLAGQLRRELGRRVRPGVTPLELNRYAEQFMKLKGAKPAQKGYHGYPYAICAAVNDCVCHGMPDGRALKEGDLVTLDFVVEWNGWMADTAWTYAVGEASEEAKKLRAAAFKAMSRGIVEAMPGKRIGDIAAAIGAAADEGAYGIVSQFGGHGIGRAMHEPPEVSHVGLAGTGLTLKEGMVLTIEPMLTIGDPDVFIAEDGWSVMTLEGGLAAQFEHTVAVTAEGPRILTL
ncbi:type I methionyl aminopeptidase [Cohnella suwonensis]|uniref:Methionine aminopeptidase n=1 Tax=Cohnella suwonensis TaxID=696072 RepID=A0ABW0LWF7_9BACL